MRLLPKRGVPLTRGELSRIITLIDSELEDVDEELGVLRSPDQVRIVREYKDTIQNLRLKLGRYT